MEDIHFIYANGFEYRVTWELDDDMDFESTLSEFKEYLNGDTTIDEVLAFWGDRGYYIS
jgi:hypothetical protein